ncbi:M48 family metallopeptidase, partial [Kaarinaea lacus]
SDELDSLQPAEIKLPATQEYWKVVYSTGAPQLSIEQNPVTNVGVMHLMIEHEKNTADLLKTWLTDKAKATLLPWLRQVSQETGLNYNTANIRSQKTRWASCSSRKNISLNRCMLFLEPKEVQYLLIHELCHTREMNHSRRFWNLVSQFVPDYPEKERLINECCYKLPRWVY